MRIVVRQYDTRIAVRQECGPRIRVQVGGLRGVPGPQGPPGAGGDSIVRAKVAATVLSGHHIVRSVDQTRVAYADSSDVSAADSVLGLTVGAAQAEADVQVMIDGEITEPGWAWTPEQTIYLVGQGQITQAPPSSPTAAFLVSVGYATSPTSMRVRIGIPVTL